MELPNELWTLIAYELKFDLDSYKKCALVNKQLCHIIKKIYDRIPDQLYIRTRVLPFWSDEIPQKIIASEYINGYYSNEFIPFEIIINELITLHKNELMNHREQTFEVELNYGGFDYYINVYFDMNKLFDKEINQICNSIIIDIYNYQKPHIYYCEDEL